jgi:hypothetical protein
LKYFEGTSTGVSYADGLDAKPPMVMSRRVVERAGMRQNSVVADT